MTGLLRIRQKQRGSSRGLLALKSRYSPEKDQSKHSSILIKLVVKACLWAKLLGFEDVIVESHCSKQPLSSRCNFIFSLFPLKDTSRRSVPSWIFRTMRSRFRIPFMVSVTKANCLLARLIWHGFLCFICGFASLFCLFSWILYGTSFHTGGEGL